MPYRLILASVAFLLLVLFIIHSVANARDLGQWEATDPEVRAWYGSLKQPDRPNVSCCGEADAYWCDEITVRGDRVFCGITDDRPDAPLMRPHIALGTEFEIPRHKYKFDSGNPTGHQILFVNGAGVLCFIQGGGV